MSGRPFAITDLDDLVTDQAIAEAKRCPIQYRRALQEPLSRDPLTQKHAGGPFAHMIPSRKYEGDYEGERVSFQDEFTAPNNYETDSAASTHEKMPEMEPNSSMSNLFMPQIAPEYIKQHKVGYMRDFDESPEGETLSYGNENTVTHPNMGEPSAGIACARQEPDIKREDQKVTFGSRILDFLRW